MPPKTGDHHVEPGAYVDELVIFAPETHIGYNAADKIVMIKKKTADGGTYVREIVDPDVTDYTVDRWQVFSRYRKVRGG